MTQANNSILVAAFAALLAATAASQSNGNDIPLCGSSGLILTVHSDPSVGAAPGTFPPDLAGDLWWRALSGEQVLAHVGPLGNVMEIDGYFEEIFDTDWSTPPWFFDRMEGPALPSLVNPGNLEPAFFQLGLTSEVFVSLGPSGLPDPCTFLPDCFLGCPPNPPLGYLVDIRFDGPPGSGIVIPADGTSASDHATTWFVPGGMPYLTAPGSCGLGDYTLVDIRSTSETQANDLPGAISAFGGFQLGSAPQAADPWYEIADEFPTFRDRVLNVIADSGTGQGLEQGKNGGGATNGLKLSVSSGAARLSWEIRAKQDIGVPNFAAAAVALAPLPLPGATVLGAALLVSPDALFFASASTTAAAGVSVWHLNPIGISEGIADFSTAVVLPVPANAVGVGIYSQGLVVHTATLQGFHTNRVKTLLLP